MVKTFNIKNIIILLLFVCQEIFAFADLEQIKEDPQYYQRLHKQFAESKKLEEVQKELENYLNSSAIFGFYIFSVNYNIEPEKFLKGLNNYFKLYDLYLKDIADNKDFIGIANLLNLDQLKVQMKNDRLNETIQWRTLQAFLSTILSKENVIEKLELMTSIFEPLTVSDIISLINEESESVINNLKKSIQVVLTHQLDNDTDQ